MSALTDAILIILDQSVCPVTTVRTIKMPFWRPRHVRPQTSSN